MFGIKLNYTVKSYTSCADTCTGVPTTYSDTTTSCSHSSTDHKTRDSIRNNLISQYGNGTDILTRIAWTGHVLESGSSNSSSNTHTVVLTVGMVTDESTNENLDDATIRWQRIYSLLHELSHQIGAPDHYCYDISSNDCDNPTEDCYKCDHKLDDAPVCLMSGRIDDIESRLKNGTLDSLYCSQCLSAIHEKGVFTHLNNHHNCD